MDRPVIVGNVHNMSLESLSDESDEYPHLLAEFSCETEGHNCIHLYTHWFPHGFKVCCAAIWLHDIHNMTVKRISITVQTPRVSGTILMNVSGIAVQLNTTCFLTNKKTVGIVIYKATSFGLYSSNASNCSYGLVLHNTTITGINKVTAMYNEFDGIAISMATNTHINNTTAVHNGGSGMYLSTMNDTYIRNINASHNGMIGQIVIVFSTTTIIYNTSFTDIYSPSVFSTIDPRSLPTVILLHCSTLHIVGCNFMRNSISAVRAYSSNVAVHGTVTFSNNTAFAGPAFVLNGGSTLTPTSNSHIYFVNNHATNVGGVIYATNNNVHYEKNLYNLKRSTCFLTPQHGLILHHKRFTFVNNSAGKGGDILYGGEILFGYEKLTLRNCLLIFNWLSSILQNGLSLISSEPLRACFCNESGHPDCLLLAEHKPHSIYPGQTINISAVVVGQNFGTVAGSVYAQFLQKRSPPQLELGQEVQRVTQHKCNDLYYTIFSQSKASTTVLVLTARDSYVSEYNDNVSIALMNYYFYGPDAATSIWYANNPVYVNVSILPCPAGFMLTTYTPFKCDCNSLLRQVYGIKCHIQEQTIGRSGLLWVGVIQDDNGTNETVAVSEYCSLNYCSAEDSNVTLSEPDSQCNYNHSGTLCGGCQPGLSLALGSAQCLQCSNKYIALLIPLTLAGPVLVFSIKLLDITISQGMLNGLIFYANIVKANEYVFFPQTQTNPLTVFIAWLNLDLGVETCLFQGLTAYSKTWLQFVFPFYIWSIAGLIIILAKYSDRVAKVMGNNSVPVLATLFLLSHAKLLRTIITALSYTMVYTSHGPKAVWTADGNVDYLGPQHAPLFATAVVVLLFLWLPYTLLLFLGHWLHRCNCRLLVRMLMKIKPFLDAHYGPVKSKHHYWFGALLLVRAAILVISALIPTNHSSIIVLCLLVTSVVLTHFGQLVYHNLAVVMFDLSFFMNLAILSGAHSFTTTAGGGVAVPAYTLIGVAFAQFVGLVIFKVFSILKRSEKVMECFRKEQPVEDEQAAVQREMESDMEEQDSSDSESIESLPTY